MLVAEVVAVLSGSLNSWVFAVSMFWPPLMAEEAEALFETTAVPPALGVKNPSLVTITRIPMDASKPEEIGIAFTVVVSELTAPEFEFAVIVTDWKFDNVVVMFVEDAKICVVPAITFPLLLISSTRI